MASRYCRKPLNLRETSMRSMLTLSSHRNCRFSYIWEWSNFWNLLIALQCPFSVGNLWKCFHIYRSKCVDYVIFGLFSNEVSICTAAGQVVENTPCPAVKFLVNIQLIMSNLCSYGWNFHNFHRNVNFSELGTRYTDIFNFEALRELPDRNPAIEQFLNIKSFHSKYSSYTILGDAVLVSTAQGYNYHRNTSVLFLSFPTASGHEIVFFD